MSCLRWMPRCAVVVASAVTMAAAAGQPALAQSTPGKPITLVVGFAAGGVADSIGRLVGQKLGERLGQTVIVENRGGAGGNIAAKAVAGAAPDGHTLLVTTTALAINETMHANKGFSVTDFQVAAVAASSPEALATHPDNPGTNIRGYLDGMAGKPITYGTAGAGSGSHIAAEYFFKVIAKAPATHVPFQGGAPATTAGVANHVGMVASTLGGGFAAQIKAGRLKGLAVASEKRVAVTPDVPTFGEGGYPGFVAASWVGFFVPAKTDAQTVARFNAAINAIVAEPDVKQRLDTLGFDPITASQAQAAAMVAAEVEKWGKMVTAVGVKEN